MKIYIFFISGLALGIALISCSSLPRRSERNIRGRILHDMPQGSTYGEVLSYAKKQNWPVTEQSNGYEKKRFGETPATIIGQRAIKAYLGGYRGLPWHVDVDCFWAFDEHDQLIDVFISKETDAP